MNEIETRLAETRIIGCVELVQSIPFPQSTPSKPKTKEKKTKTKSSTKQTYQTIEQMTPVKKILHEQETESEKTPVTNPNEQRLQLEGNLTIPKVKTSCFFFDIRRFRLDRNSFST